jgi:hypothetical protein
VLVGIKTIFRPILRLFAIVERTFRSVGELASATLLEVVSRLGLEKIADKRQHVYPRVRIRDYFVPANDLQAKMAIARALEMSGDCEAVELLHRIATSVIAATSGLSCFVMLDKCTLCLRACKPHTVVAHRTMNRTLL